ncbi:MAG TPA: phasin family protein [Patescibacteria group bacterium]|jgi:poly(hydroxyalkanoate) granule-associated protein|nr:phasin family protein [Patescibacteria group bacterium]
MTDEVEITEESPVEDGPNPMLEMARKVLLAGIGAMALTQEEIEKFVGKLVERGEIAEKDGRKLITDIMDRRRKKTAEVRSGTEDEVEKRMEGVLARMNIASKSDIDGLNIKITALTNKLDDLKN